MTWSTRAVCSVTAATPSGFNTVLFMRERCIGDTVWCYQRGVSVLAGMINRLFAHSEQPFHDASTRHWRAVRQAARAPGAASRGSRRA